MAFTDYELELFKMRSGGMQSNTKTEMKNLISLLVENKLKSIRSVFLSVNELNAVNQNKESSCFIEAVINSNGVGNVIQFADYFTDSYCFYLAVSKAIIISRAECDQEQEREYIQYQEKLDQWCFANRSLPLNDIASINYKCRKE
ncbi:hypothetical protein, partial [Pseudoalteromonas nigrifaciens]